MKYNYGIEIIYTSDNRASYPSQQNHTLGCFREYVSR